MGSRCALKFHAAGCSCPHPTLGLLEISDQLSLVSIFGQPRCGHLIKLANDRLDRKRGVSGTATYSHVHISTTVWIGNRENPKVSFIRETRHPITRIEDVLRFIVREPCCVPIARAQCTTRCYMNTALLKEAKMVT